MYVQCTVYLCCPGCYMVYFPFRLWFWFSFASFLGYNPTTHVRRQWHVWIKHRRNNTTRHTGTRLLVQVNTLFISLEYSSPLNGLPACGNFCCIFKMICHLVHSNFPQEPFGLGSFCLPLPAESSILQNILWGLEYFHFRLINAHHVTVGRGNACVLPERKHFVFVCNILCLSS